MTTDDIELIEKLEQAASEILGKPIPFRALVQFIASVERPEIPRLEPIRQRPMTFNPERWFKR